MSDNTQRLAISEDLLEIQQTAVDFERRKRDTRYTPKFYRSVLTETLRERVTNALMLSSEDQVSILEELAILREAASIKVQEFSKALTLYNDNPTEDVRALLFASINMIMEDFGKISRIAKTASDIRNAARDKYAVGDLHDIVNQLTRIMFEICGDEHERIARVFEQRVEKELSFIQPKTDLTPDQVVTAMDLTVPFVDEDSWDDNKTAVI